MRPFVFPSLLWIQWYKGSFVHRTEGTIMDDEQANHAHPGANAGPGASPVDLVPTSTQKPNAAAVSSFLPGTPTRRRDEP